MNKIGKREGGKETGVSVLMKERVPSAAPCVPYTMSKRFSHNPPLNPLNPFRKPLRKPITLNL